MRLTFSPVNFFNIVDLLVQVDQDQNTKTIFTYDVVKHIGVNGSIREY